MEQTVGHFNILERLGGGALGDVYRARDTKVGRTVALMVAPPAIVSDPAQRELFLQEARAASALNHPNIAMLFDVVEQNGQLYLAYEFAAGPSLRQEMGGKAVNMRRAVELVAQIADAVAEGHATGFVHGDLRPETVVVTPKGSTKILNFGMGRWTEGAAARRKAAVAPDTLTLEEAQVTGYLSPEQAVGATVDSRTDLFSLGVVLYEMLTGRNPFSSETPARTIQNVAHVTPPAPSAVRLEVPAELDAVMARALAKDPKGRCQSAASLAAELRRVVTLLDVQSGDAGPPTLIPLDEDRGTRPWWILLPLAAALAAWWVWG
jgi:eukaryotic-like serine/threonine-protein kinase